jgi:hypothetical protein
MYVQLPRRNLFMQFISPSQDSVFTITSGAEWPGIALQTDATGPHTWNWKISWGAFQQSGSVNTPSNQWDAQSVVTNFGGTLTVSAQDNNSQSSIQNAATTVTIKGTNPSAAEVTQFLASQPGSAGFDKILMQESRCRHFNAAGEPIKSFDNGYGMCQLTNPVPSFGQVWNWKWNVLAGLSLFAEKRAAAINYLSQSNRTYTDEQLEYEAVSRWNGGSYHEWDDHDGKWIRHPNILCDSATGNIGWDMNDPANAGHTEADLHKRDSPNYGKPPAPGAHWKYSGVCYADKVLG